MIFIDWWWARIFDLCMDAVGCVVEKLLLQRSQKVAVERKTTPMEKIS